MDIEAVDTIAGMTFSLAVPALAKIVLYLLVVVLAAAVISPPAYWLLNAQLDFPFYRYFSRVAQITAIVLVGPLLLWLRIRSFAEFGLARNPRKFRDLGTGFLLAFLPVLLLGAGYLWFDIYKIKPELLPAVLARIALTACVVAAVEEFLFRGVLLGLSVRAFGRIPAAIAVSLIFAAVHFLKPAKLPDATVEWWSGFAQIPRVAGSLPPAELLLGGFASLVLVGLILALAALRTRSLFLPIGLHAGWVFGQQGLQWLAKSRIRPEDALLPWIGPNVVSGAVPTGIIPLALLMLTGSAVWLYLRYASSTTGRP